MDFLDRLTNVLRGIVTDDQSNTSRAWDRGRSSGDPDLDEAWDELDDFLNEGREGPSAPDAASSSAGSSAGGQGTRQQQAPISPKTERAYATIGVPVDASAAEVRAAYKKLMRQHHPDRFAGDAERARQATVTAARINAAYEHIVAQSQRRRQS